MATYDLTRTDLNDVLANIGHVEPGIRNEIISTLEDVGVYTDPSSTATTVVVNDGNQPDDPNVVIYTDNVHGFVPGIPDDATAIVFATDDGVTASIDGSDSKIVVSGDGNDVLFMSGDSDDKIFSGGNDLVSAGVGDDTVLGEAETIPSPVGSANDEIRGSGGNDSLSGDSGDDTMFGGAETTSWMPAAATTCCLAAKATTPMLGGSGDDP